VSSTSGPAAGYDGAAPPSTGSGGENGSGWGASTGPGTTGDATLADVRQHPPSDRAATSGSPAFDERLSVPLWWFLPAIGVAALIGAEVHMGYPGLRSWIGYAIVVPLAVLVLVWLSRSRVRVADGELRVGDSALPLERIGRVEVVAVADKQAALGPELDPTAFLLHRPWIGPVVRVEVRPDPGADGAPADRTPYWVFSVRDTAGLVAALGR
jgi:hypothetical protein